jgi:hypothetical protein
MALLFLPFGGLVPAGVALLWVTNSFFSVILGVLLRQDAIRAALGLPTLARLQVSVWALMHRPCCRMGDHPVSLALPITERRS